VELELQERGLIVRFAEQVFFDLGEAALKPEALEVLKTLAGTLKTLPNPLRVEGHTDNWPISTARFPSNWELSVHRATNVVRFLIEEEGFDPNKLSVAGYSEYRPIRPNDTAEDRAMNRRVDIVILSLDLWDFEPN
jgi:chemotaxis protein MotB